MKLIIDITHPANISFFKNAIEVLSEKYGWEIALIVQPRGQLVSILKKEYPNFSFKPIGTYRNSVPGKAANLILRCFRLYFHLISRDWDLATSFDDMGLSYVAYLLRKPLVVFEDDIEYRVGFPRYRAFPTLITMPKHIPVEGKNILKYNGFKELAYLHPNYFKPNKEVLREYGLHNQDYVFIREVITTTMDYRHQKGGQLAKICSHLKAMNFDIVVSLEDKSLIRDFEDKCIILEEPVEDIYSLMYFANFTIASGDTMARESCLLGTPAIYTGGREMSINSLLKDKGCFFKADTEQEIIETIKKITDENIKKKTEKVIAEAIRNEWEDTTEVIVKTLLNKT